MISRYHSQVGRQGRAGAGYQGMRYDQPLSTFVSRPMMEPEDDLAEPVAQKTLEGSMTPLDVVKSLLVEQPIEAPVEKDGAGGESPAGLPASADPVSSGDPDSIGYGGTISGDRGKTPMEAVSAQFSNDIVSDTLKDMIVAPILSQVLDAPVFPFSKVKTAVRTMKRIPEYIKTYQKFNTFPDVQMDPNMADFSNSPRSIDDVMGVPIGFAPYATNQAELDAAMGGGTATGQGSGSTHGFGENPGSVSSGGTPSSGNIGGMGTGGEGGSSGGGIGGSVGPGAGGGGGGNGVGGVGW